MKVIRTSKRKISIFLNEKIKNEKIINFLRLINNVLFHKNMKKRVLKRRKGKVIMIFPIGHGTDTSAGLMAIFLVVAPFIYWCRKKGYIPYIDGKHYKCQYSVDRLINETDNAWEYYFDQPATSEELRSWDDCKLVIDGWTLFKDREREECYKEFYLLGEERQRRFIEKNLPVNRYVLHIAEEKEKELDLVYNETLGVFLRGTDYVRIKPKGHSVQPEINDAIDKIKEYDKKYSPKKIFLVTEDAGIFSRIKSEFGDRVICSDYEFVGYNANDNLYVYEAFDNDPYERGLNYLVRLIILSKCSYLIASKASGSYYAITMGHYKDRYIFDLGYY